MPLVPREGSQGSSLLVDVEWQANFKKRDTAYNSIQETWDELATKVRNDGG